MKNTILSILAIAAGTFFIAETASLGKVFELRQGVIVHLQWDENAGNPDGHTWVRYFEDGYVEDFVGIRGEMGDTIFVKRQCGTASLFGLFGKDSRL